MKEYRNDKILRQGDCILRRIDTIGLEDIPEGIPLQKSLELLHGENGHSHVLKQALVYELPEPKEYKRIEDGKTVKVLKFIEAKQDTELVHEEHPIIPVFANKWALTQERELDVLEQKVRSVVE